MSCLDRRIVVLCTSVGNEALHGFVPALRRVAPMWVLLGTDMCESAAGFALCDDGWTVPARSAPDYLDTIEALVREHDVDLVYPLSTRDQDYFADPAVRARLGVPVVVAEPEVLAAANTKVGLFEAVDDVAILPDHRTVRTPDEAVAALAELVDAHGAAVLKRDLGTGGAGMLFVGAPEADAAPVTGRTLLTVPEASARLKAEPARVWSRPAQVVGWLPGAEYSVDVLADRGTVLAGVVRLRRSSVGGLATDSETVDAPDVWAAALSVARALGLQYVNNIQFRRDAGGVPRLMEINPRIPGTIGLTVEAGLNLPLGAAVMALGEQPRLVAPELGVRVLRHAGAVYTRRRFDPAGTGAPSAPALADRVRDAVGDGAALLWDLDGTLVRLRVSLAAIRGWKTTLQKRFGPYGWDGGWSPMLPSLERAIDCVAAGRGRRAAEVVRHTTYVDLDRWEDEAIEGIERLEGIASLQEHLARPTAIVTNNGWRAAVRGLVELEAAGVDTKRIDALVHRGPAHPAKPSPAMFTTALERLGVRGGPVVVIGDSPGDAAAARALAGRWYGPVRFVSV